MFSWQIIVIAALVLVLVPFGLSSGTDSILPGNGGQIKDLNAPQNALVPNTSTAKISGGKTVPLENVDINDSVQIVVSPTEKEPSKPDIDYYPGYGVPEGETQSFPQPQTPQLPSEEGSVQDGSKGTVLRTGSTGPQSPSEEAVPIQSFGQTISCKSGECERAEIIIIKSSEVTAQTNTFTVSSQNPEEFEKLSFDVMLGNSKSIVEKSGGVVKISQGDIVSTTGEEVTLIGDSLQVAGKTISVAPQVAAESAGMASGSSSIESVRIEAKEKPLYIVEGKQSGKLLGFIPVEVQTITKIDAQTAEVVEVQKPWWSFLAG